MQNAIIFAMNDADGNNSKYLVLHTAQNTRLQ